MAVAQPNTLANRLRDLPGGGRTTRQLTQAVRHICLRANSTKEGLA